RAAGANAFISKPLFRSKLVRAFSGILETEQKQHKAPLEDWKKLDLRGHRILLVEDNELNADIAMELLSMCGLEVEYAENGVKAVDMVMHKPEDYYELILMDIQMPVMNGYDATRAIRAGNSSYHKRVPIIALTANAFAEDVQAAKTVGMNEHIAKPLDLQVLERILQKWLH
ncbi:MAG: response regulator, partial [Selenomonadaceae bacterium]|nr:response regulator [Selenomonadaceae bacterium]